MTATRKLSQMTDAQLQARLKYLSKRLEKVVALRDAAASRNDDRATRRQAAVIDWLRPQLVSAEEEIQFRQRHPYFAKEN